MYYRITSSITPRMHFLHTIRCRCALFGAGGGGGGGVMLCVCQGRHWELNSWIIWTRSNGNFVSFVPRDSQLLRRWFFENFHRVLCRSNHHTAPQNYTICMLHTAPHTVDSPQLGQPPDPDKPLTLRTYSCIRKRGWLYDSASVAAKTRHLQNLSDLKVSDLNPVNCILRPGSGSGGGSGLHDGATIFA
jgi:hypothetical protein